MPRISIRRAQTPNAARNPNINPRAWLSRLPVLLLAASGLLASSPAAWSQASPEWTWMAGSNKANQPGIYGSLGTPAPGNTPGSRVGASTWTDSSGNLWLFGGSGSDATGNYGYNDLWEFSPSTNEWTWMGGSNTVPCVNQGTCGQPGQYGNPGVYGSLGTSAPGNIPGGRYAASAWIDSSGHLWLFGGFGVDAASNAGYLNDLWEFSPSTKEWTWMGGSSTLTCNSSGICGNPGVYGNLGTPAPGNIPGGTFQPSSWTDSNGHFWLFELSGFNADGNSAYLFDFWEFNPATKEWTWRAGSNTASPEGSYGTLGVPAPGNNPPPRGEPLSWTDHSGHFWLYGGYVFDEQAFLDFDLDDLWEFNPSTNEWTWMGGTNFITGQYLHLPPVYGRIGIPAPGATPGGRVGSETWVDNSGNFWLFGGSLDDLGYNEPASADDLWEFSPISMEWTWMGGSTALNQGGVYGVFGSPAPGNSPGSRAGGSSWSDNNGNLWLFGGESVTGVADFGLHNDLWRLQLSVAGTLQATKTTLASSSASSVYTDPVTFTVKVSSGTNTPPDGDIAVFLDNGSGTPIGNIRLTGGTGQFTTLALLPGTHSITAVFPGDLTFAQSTSAALTHTVAKAPSSLKLTATPTPEGMALIATAYGPYYTYGVQSPTGTITFTSGSTVLGTASLNSGLAGIPFNSVPVGAYSLTAQYPGDENYTGSTSNAVVQVLVPPLNVWTWINGGEVVNQNGEFGILGTASAGNIPGSRDGSADWTDSAGNLWLFGGKGYDSLGAKGALNDMWKYNSTANEWTWISGSISANKPGVYGQLAVGAFTNLPGSRSGPVSWTDSSGNLWLFGGTGLDASGTSGELNDLWMFNPASSVWTWMGGSSTVGAKGGQPGVYGTLGTAAVGNLPGSRDSAASWTDQSGNFWLFGGIGFDSNGNKGQLNDLWEFNPAANQWTWIAGHPTLNTAGGRFGIYGIKGTPAAANAPGGRHSASTWIDINGNFWLFGGGGFGASGSGGKLDDLWEFNPTTNQWTWMGGPQTAGPTNLQPGVYGTQGIAAAGNFPGGRYEAASWVDKSGNFWLLGGEGFDSKGTAGSLNDLWVFNPSTNQWMWIGGSSTVASYGGQRGVYGYETKGKPTLTNIPGSRSSSATWTDPTGKLWLFGGLGDDVDGTFDLLNDLWQFQP